MREKDLTGSDSNTLFFLKSRPDAGDLFNNNNNNNNNTESKEISNVSVSSLRCTSHKTWTGRACVSNSY